MALPRPAHQMPPAAAVVPPPGQPSAPASFGGGFMMDAPSLPPAGPPPGPVSFSDDPAKMEMLRDFGLRMMIASEPRPGSAVGPSLFGAVGRAGMGTIKDTRARKAATATAAAEAKRHKDKMGMEERRIASTEALRRETIKQRAEGQRLSNEIAGLRATTDRATLEVKIADQEQDAIADLRDSTDYMIAEPPDQKRMEDNIRQTYDRIRTKNGFQRQTNNAVPRTATNAAGDKVVLRDGKWVPM